MIVYKEREKFKADMCKHLAYFFASIGGLMLIQVIVYGDSPTKFFNLQGLTALGFGLISYILMGMATAICHDLDYKLSKRDARITNEGEANE